ncbi:MAG: tRNA (adenosine(37)-N6)-dimethylallyltransferase MiaA [Lachnospiraceae bacterium]|nr:tRNA (adenosine(37)-N6)-dimethylallyltransferase MiaA [Lachnospiraceae bacterium]
MSSHDVEKPKLIVIAGPTATGKSALAVELALKIKGEIISADSMQVYRGMDIGTAKITKEEMKGVPHYLIDCLDPDEDFNVYRFQQMAKDAIETIREHGSVPIICGGTGFYIQSVAYDIAFTEEDGDDIRKELEAYVREHENGDQELYERLRTLDPEYASTLHFHNVKKVIRALTYMELNGGKFSEHNAKERARTSPYDLKYFVLTDDRSVLYDGIDKRVDKMVKTGLLQEVASLKEKGYHKGMISIQGLGYKEVLDYLDGLCTLEEAIDRIKRETRHFAKRQLTWFRREKDVIWLDRRDFDRDINRMCEYIRGLVTARS